MRKVNVTVPKGGSLSKGLWIGGLTLLLILLSVAYYFRPFPYPMPLLDSGRPLLQTTQDVEGSDFLTVAVYFPRQDVNGIEEVSLKLPNRKDSLRDWVETLIEALSTSAVAQAVPLFPPETRIRNVFLGEDGTLYVDFSFDALSSSVAGVELETLAVEAFVKTLVSNVQRAKRVKILVEGNDRDSFWGHVYVKKPLEAP